MKFFKLNKLRRFLILGVTIVAAILAITFGSLFEISKNARIGLEYGGGTEYIVQVKPEDSNVNASDISESVAESISDRIDPLGVVGADVQPERTGEGNAQIRITYPGIKNKHDVDEMQELIVNKPTLTLTDIYGNPLFDQRGHFNRFLESDPKGFVGVPGMTNTRDIETFESSDSKTPIAVDGAKGQLNNSGQHEVQLNLINESYAKAAWTEATSYVSKLPQGVNQIISWINYDEYIEMAKDRFPTDWVAAQHSPYLFAHVENKLASDDPSGELDEDNKPKQKLNILKKNVFDAEEYLISIATVSQALSGTSFVISGNFNQSEVNQIARQINYGVARYTLSSAPPRAIGAAYGSSSFDKAIIAGIIVFSLIAIFLIVNYGLLGVLSTISIGLYIFLILALFTVMRGEYSPETIAALIIGIGMGVDANIITFERLKSEVYSGSTIKKAFNKSNKRSLTTILDANITTLIVAFILFYFGTKSIVGLSVTLILSIMFTLIIMLGLTRFMSTMLVNTGVFEKRKRLLGIRPKFDVKVQEKINKFDYVKNSKWFVMSSAIIFVVAIIVMATMAGIGGSINKGFNLSQDFTGGTIMDVKFSDSQVGRGILKELSDLLNTKYGVPSSDISISENNLSVHSSTIIDLAQLLPDNSSISGTSQELHSILNNSNVSQISNTTSDIATQLVRDAMIAISVAIALIIVYTMIRFRWTFSIAAIIALIHDGLMVTAIFVLARVEISPVFIAGLLSILGYSINDTIVTFDRIREKMNNTVGKLDVIKIKRIANDAIKDTLKRSILTSVTTITAVIVLMSFGNATKLSFNLAMLVGLIAGTYSSIFIASYAWVKLEILRQKRIEKRLKNGFWKTDKIEEQTFAGINDFTP